jgi:hypothetical protein
MMDLTGPDVEHLMAKGMSFARVIWLFYGAKAGFEAQYKALIDLGMHRLPCRKHIRNAGFYAVATFAHTLGVAVDLIGGRGAERGSWRRTDGGRRKRAKPRRMRLGRLRRCFLALPARITTRARVMHVKMLSLSERMREEFKRYFLNICRC